MSWKPLISESEQKVLAGLLLISAVGALAGLLFNPQRFWPSLLLHSFFFLSLALGALVFVAIQFLANAGWSVALRRVPEAMMGYLPVGAIMLLLVFFGRHTLYEWTHPEAVQGSHALQAKAAYLNTPFFFARMAVFLLLWTVFMRLLRSESRAQDADGALEHTRRSRKYSAIFIVLFAITFSLASFDWLMSLEPEFYSTIFAFYCFAGLFVSGIAAITLLVLLLRARGLLPHVNEEHLHNLGKLVLSFATFWAYIWLSQYLLIYYTNFPEETGYYLRRTGTPGWQALFILNLLLNWLIPFVMLLPRMAKRGVGWLAAACVIVLAGHWLDLYTMVMPALKLSPMINWIDVAMFCGFGALFLIVFRRNLERSALMPTRDPYLEESLSLHPLNTVAPASVWSSDSRRALILATAAFGVTFAGWGMVGALAPHFRELYQLSPMQTSALIAMPVLLGSLGRLPLGVLADRHGGRAVLGSLLVVSALLAIGAGLSGSYGTLLGWTFFLGFAGASFSAGVTFVSKWFPPNEQGTALGVYGMGNIGQSIAVLGAPALVALTGNWRIPFWIYAGIAYLCGQLFFLTARDAPAKAQPKRLSGYFTVLRRKPLAWVLALLYFQTFGGFVALGVYLPTMLKDIFGLTPLDAGARVAGFVIVATMMRPVGGWLADWHGGARVLLIVFSLLPVFALSLTMPQIVPFTIGALGGAALLGIGNGAVFKLVPEYFPRETGTVTGLVGALGGLGGFFPPLVLGYIHTQTGSYRLGFVLLSCFAVLCMLVTWRAFVCQRERLSEALLENY
ncbi:MAG: NarK/NasA family nitrate transporter [Acidobacteria bacterium]|nr:NarK/NasA family nitrate transporter [Acidobacteriota bacterium]